MLLGPSSACCLAAGFWLLGVVTRSGFISCMGVCYHSNGNKENSARVEHRGCIPGNNPSKNSNKEKNRIVLQNGHGC